MATNPLSNFLNSPFRTAPVNANTGATTPTGYNAAPDPNNWDPTYGGVPGTVGVPDPYSDLSRAVPGLAGLNAQASQGLLAELAGQLSPTTQAMLQDKAAQWGVMSGVPGSGLARSRNLRDLGLTSEALQSQGLRDYGAFIPAVSRTQVVDPALQAEIAARNANIKSAPVPSFAQSYAQNLFDRYLQNMRGPGGGSRGSLFGPSSGTGDLGSQALGFGAGQQYPFAGPISSGGLIEQDYFPEWQFGTGATTSSRQSDDSADLLNQFFAEGPYAPPPPPPEDQFPEWDFGT